jgi:hypothetical protein
MQKFIDGAFEIIWAALIAIAALMAAIARKVSPKGPNTITSISTSDGGTRLA